MHASLVWSRQVCSGFKVGKEALMFPSFLTVKRHKTAIDLSTHTTNKTAVVVCLKVTPMHKGLWKEGGPQCKSPHLTFLSCHMSAPFHQPHGPLSINPRHIWHLLGTKCTSYLPPCPVRAHIHPQHRGCCPGEIIQQERTAAGGKLSSCSNWGEVRCEWPQGWNINWMGKAPISSFSCAHLLKDHVSPLSSPKAELHGFSRPDGANRNS